MLWVCIKHFRYWHLLEVLPRKLSWKRPGSDANRICIPHMARAPCLYSGGTLYRILLSNHGSAYLQDDGRSSEPACAVL